MSHDMHAYSEYNELLITHTISPYPTTAEYNYLDGGHSLNFSCDVSCVSAEVGPTEFAAPPPQNRFPRNLR